MSPAFLLQPLRRAARIIARRRWAFSACVFAALVLIGAGFVWSSKRASRPPAFEIRVGVPSVGAGFELALYQSLNVRLEPGHTVELLNNGTVFDSLERDILAAQSSVHLLFYIWEKGAASDRISAALEQRARAGVACRVLVDDLGSADFAQDVQPALARAGCQIRIFRPQSLGNTLARNHRKLAIIDAAFAYTGGFGIRDNWLGDGIHGDHWRDTCVRFSGPSVAQAQQAFAENWQEAGGELLPETAFPKLGAAVTSTSDGRLAATLVTSTGSSELTRAERLTQLMIATAKHRIWIENAYFVPTRGISGLLCEKASRGVDVRLMVPGKKSDSKTSFGAQHAEFGSLIEHGVQVFEYQPAMLHAKTMIIDDELALIGSINLDPLSLSHLEEDALVVAGRPVVDSLARSFTEDCVHAKEKRP